MTHTGLQHFGSSPGLGLARGTYAKRYRPWPPVGFKEPTREELSAVVHRLKNPSTWAGYLLRRKPTEELARHLQVIDWFHDRPELSRAMDYIHAIRREITSRPDAPVFQSLRHDRCGVCSHASDRLWESTGGTHNITDRNDEPVKSTFVCARCWSDYLIKED